MSANQIEPFGNAFRFKTLSDDYVYIGDPSDREFHPKITLNRWQGECFLKILYDDSNIPKSSRTCEFDASKVRWNTPDFVLNLYPSTDAELGGLEIEIILKKKPSANVFAFRIQSQGLKFYYQPPLTKEEIDAGAVRPENVVGSYAVYHATKTSMHRSKEDAEKYRAGKAFHIYRPKATDSAGNTAWCDLNIDEALGVLMVTVPQEFLDKAVYPVSVDPTFGYTTVGGTEQAYVIAEIRGSWFTCPESGTANSVTAYLAAPGGGSYGKAGLYKKSDYSLVGQTPTQYVPQAAQWNTFNFSSPQPSLSNIDYYIVFASAGASLASRISMYYDAETGKGAYSSWSIDGLPDPWSPTVEDKKYSIYCTYTAAAPIVTVTDSVGLSDTALCHKTFAVSDYVGLTDTPLKGWTPTVTDAVSLYETVLRNKAFSILDSVGLTDAVYANKNFIIQDTVSLADVALAIKFLLLMDSISLSDAVSVYVGAILKVVEDSIGLSDAVYRNKSLIISDAVSLVEQVFRHKPLLPVSDVLTLAEMVSVSKLLAVADSVSLSDVAKVLKQLRVIDSITLVDATQVPSKILAVLDSIGLSDVAKVDKALIVSDQIALVEVVYAAPVRRTKLFLVIGNLAIQLTGG
jgi:hypothetical protein